MGLLSSRFNRPDSGVMHTNAMASVSPGSFGNTTTETFGQRKSIDSSRMHVKNFRHAGVIHAYRQHAAVARATPEPSSRHMGTVSSGRQGFNSHSSPAPTSRTTPLPPAIRREPPSRGYNPFA